MSGQRRSGRSNRRPSRANKYHQQYLSFLRKWKSYVHAQQYQECERLCLDHIDRIDRSIRFQIKQYAQRHGGAHLDYNDSRFYDIKNYRSKVRNLYAVLLHDYLKQHNDALEQYELCVEDDEFNASAHYNWAILYKNFYKDYESAEVHYRKAIELKPNHAAYHNNYGLLLEQQLKKYDPARKQFGIALSLDDKNGRAHTNMANLLKKHYKDYETAKIHYEKAINLDPQNPTRHFNYALFLKHNLNDYTAAADEYEKAINLDHNYYQAHNEYKNFLLTESPFDRHKHNKYNISNTEKQEHCTRCIKYAIQLLWNKKTKDAKEIMQMALKCQPNNAFAKLVQEPYSNDIDMNTMYATMDTREYQQIAEQKENELYNLFNKMDRFHRRLSTITSKLKQTQASNLTMPQQNSESNWNLGQLHSLTNEMGQEIARLNSTAFSPGPSDDEDEDRVTFNNPNLYGTGNPGAVSGSQFDNGSFKRTKMMKPYGQNMYGDTNGRAAYLDSKNATKRNSLISVQSASDFNQKYMDIHKQTLFSAAKIIENIMNESRSENSTRYIDDEYKKKLDDVMHMIFATVRVWDYIDFEAETNFDVQRGRLTEHNVMNHNDVPKENEMDSGLLTPVDAMYETAQTLGAVSMISQTSSAAMAQRKTFLKKAANNPNVRKADRLVAKHLAQQFLSTHGDTPQSVLSQSQLPFFSDEDESEEEDQTYSNGQRNKFKHTKKNTNPTQQHINCEQRVKRWKQMGKLQQHLAQIGTWDFDVFYVVENAGNYAMPAIALTLFETKDLVNELKLNTTAICNFFHQISLEYKNNPYHNISHGCDVLVNCSYFLDAKLMRNIRTIDKFACLVAGATHDVGHPGNNNTYEINKESDFAVTYNDISVLESYHIALAWQVMKRPGCNILSSLDNKQRKEFRKLFIDSILNTDMSHHAEQQKLLAELIDAVTISGVDLDHLDPNELDDDVAPDEDNDKASETPSVYDNIAPNSIYADPVKFAKVVIPLMVHTADLSNPSKDLKLYGKWADRVVQEFFNQAENEKKFGLPVTSFMDKEQTDLPTIQTGFVNHVIRPWFDLWGRLLRDKKQGPLFQKNVNENLKFMQNELDKLKKEKENEVKEKVDDYDAMKRRFKEQEPKQLKGQAQEANQSNRKEGEKRNSISVVDMTFEDINREAMKELMQRTEELKSRQKEYYQDMNQNMMNSHEMEEEQEYAPRVHYDQDMEEDVASPPTQQQQQAQPRKKKLLYTGSVDTANANNHSDQNGYNAKNRKTKKAKKLRKSRGGGGGGNSRELTSIPEVI
eukprot:1749_1